MNEWISWNGDNVSYSDTLNFGDRVEILMRGDYRNEGYCHNFVWGHFDNELDIMFYRLSIEVREE